jgi:hypothetical protein
VITIADVIQVKPSARIQLLKNTGSVLYNQHFAPAAVNHTSHVVQALTVATNTSVVLNQGNIVTVKNALIQADNAVTVLVNGQSSGAPLVGTNSVWAAFSAAITSLKASNASTTNTVTVNYTLSN